MAEAELAKRCSCSILCSSFLPTTRWTHGCYDDGNGGHCLVGALLHLGRKHRPDEAAQAFSNSSTLSPSRSSTCFISIAASRAFPYGSAAFAGVQVR